VGLGRTNRFPYIGLIRRDDPGRNSRLFYSKSFIYPLAAAPFVALFGTNGFLILHALLVTVAFFLAYTFLVARGSAPGPALTYAGVFFVASVVPVYFVWLTPEIFNFSLALYALFLWAYKEVAADMNRPGWLAGPASDYAAAALIGLLIFSKPTHGLLLMPL